MSIPIETIREIQQACNQIDDDIRWLIAIISDTGMRLAEAAGLNIDDFRLNEAIPCVDIRPHPWRPLKTKGSERQVPPFRHSMRDRLRAATTKNVQRQNHPPLTSLENTNRRFQPTRLRDQATQPL